ncbi:hypothetical protein K7X08_022074 [Anisodus acutangulus]|uniref:Protein TIC 214 n=1 Tax=Anisodus acutangulus TaxID=402998 RepID=A0A9Q1L6X4_9SOLA|nr:hypothetical protein K7X08_022074 [Anisodus acutangulus]
MLEGAMLPCQMKEQSMSLDSLGTLKQLLMLWFLERQKVEELRSNGLEPNAYKWDRTHTASQLPAMIMFLYQEELWLAELLESSLMMMGITKQKFGNDGSTEEDPSPSLFSEERWDPDKIDETKEIRVNGKDKIKEKFHSHLTDTGYNFEGNVDDVNVLNEIREKVREQALVNAITLKKLIKKGIPPILRPKVWFSLSGAAKKKSTAPESYYEDLTKAVQDKVTPATKQIDHDLPRTFPGHPWLDTAEGHTALRRVLVAYSFRDSDVGYCQGMNYVAALLLLVMKTEDEAFWMIAVFLENVLVSDCYSKNLSGCHVEQRVFKDLLNKKAPRIAAHLDALEFDVSLVCTEWFLCLFAKSLPSETTLQVWDVHFNEGENLLFHMNEEELLTVHHVGDVIHIIQRSTHQLFDPDDLLTVAFDQIGFMTTTTISRQRKKQEPAVTAELDQRLRRLNSISAGDEQQCMRETQ